MSSGPAYVCSGCGAVQERQPGGYLLLHHKPGCLRGAAIVGGEFGTAAAHADARAATEESMEHDYAVMKSRGDA